MSWCVLVPQKALATAKSRLELEPAARRALATAMLRDTVAAVAAAPGVAEVVVVWDDPRDAAAVPWVRSARGTPGSLNGSLAKAAREARRRSPGLGVAVVPGDLPALDSAELSECLRRAADHPRSYLPDAGGAGTTLLAAATGIPLEPSFGTRSAAAHAAAGFLPLPAGGVETVRSDVDDLAALARAQRLGYGHHTGRCCASLGLVPEAAR